MGITLYTDKFWISPYVFSCFIALREKGLDFEARTVSLGDREQLGVEFRARSLTGRVPALEHDGFGLAESSAIVEYLEDAFPPPGHARLLPADVRQRARARQILAWLRSDLDALRQERPTTTMFYERATAPLSAAGEQAKDKLLRVAAALLPAGGTTLFGAFSIADADLAFALGRLVENGHAVPPGVRAFYDAQWARPSVRAFVERERPAFVPY